MDKNRKNIINVNGILIRSLIWLMVASLPSTGWSSDSSISLDPSHIEAQVWLGSTGNYAALERQVVRLLQEDPYSAFGHYMLALLMVRDFSAAPQNLDVLRRASDLAQQAVELAPQKDYGYVALAEVLDLIGQAPKATELITRSMMHGMQPSWRVYFVLAKLNAEIGSSEHVFAYLEQALSFSDAQADIIVPYVVAMIEATHSGKKKQDLLTTWNNRFPHIEFKQAIAIALAENGDYQAASKLYSTMISDENPNLEAKFNNAVLQYRHLGQLNKARDTLLTLHPEAKTLSPSLKFLLNTHLGVIMLMEDKSEAAERYFLESATYATDTKAFIQYTHQQFIEHSNEKNLSRFYQKLIDKLPGHAALWALLGETQTEQDQNYKSAIESYTNAILLEPKQSNFYNGLGITYYRMERYQDALKVFNSAIAIDPRDAVAHYNQACMLARLGRHEQALSSLQEALALNPRLGETAIHDEDFASIRENRKFIQLVSTPSDMEYTETRDFKGFAH